MPAQDRSSARAGGQRPGTSVTLIDRARDNDGGAWERLLELYRPLVYYWCSTLGVRDADADDVVQDVFQAAFTSLPTFRKEKPGDTFRGWLRTIARRTLGRSLAGRQRRPQAGGGTDAQLRLAEIPEAELADEDPPCERQALYRRGLELVRSQFEENTWTMFWLTVVEEKAPADVAAQFGVSPAAVRKAKSRVLHRLKQEVGDAAE